MNVIKNKLTSTFLLPITACVFTSCGELKEGSSAKESASESVAITDETSTDTKASVVDALIDNLLKTMTAEAKGDVKAMEALKKEAKKLEVRAKSVDLDPNDTSYWPAELNEKFNAAMEKGID